MAVTPAPIAIPTGTCVRLYAAITTTGAQPAFTFPMDPTGTDFSVVFEFVGTGTGLTVNLEVSLDGGTSWANYLGGATALVTTVAAPAAKVQTPMVSGALFRLNVTAVTAGSTDVWIASN